MKKTLEEEKKRFYEILNESFDNADKQSFNDIKAGEPLHDAILDYINYKRKNNVNLEQIENDIINIVKSHIEIEKESEQEDYEDGS